MKFGHQKNLNHIPLLKMKKTRNFAYQRGMNMQQFQIQKKKTT